MDQSSFRWGWFPWRRETCLSRFNGWPGERTPGPASIVTSCVSGLLSYDGLMSLLGNAGPFSLLPWCLSCYQILFCWVPWFRVDCCPQSWECPCLGLQEVVTGAKGGVFQQHGHQRAQPVRKEEPGVWLFCSTRWWSRQTQSLQGPAPAVSLHWPRSCVHPHLVLRAGSLSALYRWRRPPDHACGPHPTLPVCFFKK